ncbi:META domain-containing protein [Spirochaeta isovalerica]|uniref:Heat shock protein HslJ n=1 Tax=Spirochaeta isovalerica TaxID=150 RepID=A0A841R5N7_9SPIO|nr:META domain-containing protein [Spirochaeta isovalerica]MBB6479146.1 heat shock protein HslJ [Spirochaeta isovalerica]
MKRFLLPFFVLLLIAAGCASTENSIENTRWYLVEIEGDRDIVQLNDKDPFIELDFESLKVGGNASCNNFFGDYSLESNNLSFGMIATTMMACPDETDQEHRFLQSLSRIDAYEIRNDLLYLLENGKPILVFEKR